MSRTRLLKRINSTFANKLQGVLKTHGYPMGYFNENADGSVKMGRIRTVDLAEDDGTGKPVKTIVPVPYLAPNGQECFYSDQSPVMVDTNTIVAKNTDVKVINYDRIIAPLNSLPETERNAVIAILEYDVWVGIMTDPDNHNRVISRRLIIN